MEFSHIPVMAREVISALEIRRDGIYVDCTLGGGGHTKMILSALSENGRVIGIDRDEDAIINASEKIKDPRFTAVRDNFENIASVLAGLDITEVDGILMDLGVSSHQLDTAERGFSYIREAPLDMRMDKSASLTAYEVVNSYPRSELIRILRDYGEEKFAGRIASAIVEKRSASPIVSTLGLSEIVSGAIPGKFRYEGGNPAKRSFQAIRIEVNGELDAIPRAIADGAQALRRGGRMAVISFHSLEDRIVKNSFIKLERPCTCPKDFPVCVCGAKQTVRIITKKPLTPEGSELDGNSRAHSAKLRVCERV